MLGALSLCMPAFRCTDLGSSSQPDILLLCAEAVSALLAAGAGDQLEWQGRTGLRALHCAADYLRPLTTAQLLELGASVDARDK